MRDRACTKTTAAAMGFCRSAAVPAGERYRGAGSAGFGSGAAGAAAGGAGALSGLGSAGAGALFDSAGAALSNGGCNGAGDVVSPGTPPGV
ncbi:MAG: hypothetical protein M3463_15795, partial [Verrucomicrobiota bacterium]|nr:hypothetical protein [Verrucomicrobiota bacterium]